VATTNLTWTGLGSKPGLRGYRQATNLLSHDTTCSLEREREREREIKREENNKEIGG